jgi:hypothetical protein
MMHALTILAERPTQAFSNRSYPIRLPLPNYPAWDMLTRAMTHIADHADAVTRHGADIIRYYDNPGDYDAHSVLYEARNKLLTPRKERID